MQSEECNSPTKRPPFEQFSEFQEGYESGRFLVGMKHRLPALARALPVADVLFYFLFIFSPFILGTWFSVQAFRSGNYWFLLGLPIAWLDFCNSTGAINMLRLLLWAPLAVLGKIISPYSPCLGPALIPMGIAFVFTSLFCSMGLGMAKIDLESRIAKSESAFNSAFAVGLIFIVDSTTGTVYEHDPPQLAVTSHPPTSPPSAAGR